MKKRRNIYFSVGIILICINFLVDVSNPDGLNPDSQDSSYDVGYYIGYHFLAIIGIILLVTAYRYHRKIKLKEANKSEEDAINSIGKK